jgi:epoxyqueuosine reductase
MSDLLPRAETAWIQEQAERLGFAACGIAAAERFPELAYYQEWLDRGYAGQMRYLEDARRLDPRNAVPGVRSIIVCALNYNSVEAYSTEVASAPNESGRRVGPGFVSTNPQTRGWVSRYAWGEDYHQVLSAKLNALTLEMRGHFAQEFQARAYADTGPIHERAAAKYAGLGWLAKNTLLINQSLGSWLFLGVVLTSLPLRPTLDAAEAPPPDRCGTCRRCLEACPTEAFVEPYVLDARRCISYLTIELRGIIPEEFREPMGRHIFGCDICQDVCPWNRKSPRTLAQEFAPRRFFWSHEEAESLFSPDLLRIVRLSPEQFREAFRGSAVKRTKWAGLIRNACLALGNSEIKRGTLAYQEAVETLEKLSRSGNPAISESALWALSRIQPEEE